MDIKTKILERKIRSLDPERDGETIARLKDELGRLESISDIPEQSRSNGGKSPSRPLTQEDVKDYLDHGPREVVIGTRWGNVHLVKERTGADRFEITPDELLKLDTGVTALDGTVVSLRFGGIPREGEADDDQSLTGRKIE